MARFKPRLRIFGRNPNSYDLIFIGTPVWAGTYSPAVDSFIQRIALADKKVAIFCCHSGRSGKMLDKMKERLACSDIVGQKSFFKPLTFEKVRNARIAKGWACETVKKCATPALADNACVEDLEQEFQACVNF